MSSTSTAVSQLLVKLRNLTIRTEQRYLVRGVNVDVHPRTVTALCGPSGAGKSLTARAIMGVLDVVPGLEAGEIYYPGLEGEAGAKKFGKNRKILNRFLYFSGSASNRALTVCHTAGTAALYVAP